MELIEWQLSHENRPLSLEIYAQRARDWWGLWNRGYPIAKVLAHFPHPNMSRGTYVTIHDTFHSTGNFERIEEVKMCFFRFIIEYERIKTQPLMDGWFRPVLASPGDSSDHSGALPRVVFLPTQSSQDGFLISDEREIYHATWNLISEESELEAYPEASQDSNWKRRLIDWIQEKYGPTFFPYSSKKKRKKYASGFYLVLGKSEVGDRYALLHSSLDSDNQFSLVNLWGSTDTNLIVTLSSNLESDFAPVLNFPRIALSSIRFTKSRFTIAQTWFSLISCLNNVSNNRVHANLTYSLGAELLEGYNNVIPIRKENDQKFSAMYVFDSDEQHRIWGQFNHPNALEFADMAFEEGAGEVAINKAFDCYTWSQRDIFQIAKAQDDEPHSLYIEKSEHNMDATFPEKGYLKISNHGNRSIAQRKNRLVVRSSNLEVITERLEHKEQDSIHWLEKHNLLTRNLEFGNKWRLQSIGPVQLVQGPPGTGKTWTSTRLVEDILRANPAAKILICSKEHLALDHLVDSLQNSLEGTNFRIARVMSSAYRSAENEDLEWERDSREYWRLFSENKSINDVSNLIQSDEGEMKLWTYGAYLDECQILCSTTTDVFLIENLQREQPMVFDYCIVEEAGKSYISELLGALAFSRTWVLVGDQMQLPPYQIQQSKLHCQTVIEAVAGNDTLPRMKTDYVTKMMGTISYHLKWGALGEYGIEAYIEKQMQQTFEPFKNFHARMQQHNGTHFLPEQRRMFKSLSDMISTIFYDTTFDWKKESEVVDEALPQIIQNNNRLIFINTPHSSRYKEWKESTNQQHSRQNKLEAEAVVSLLHHFDNKKQVVILAPYKGQVELIRSLLPKDKQHIQVHTTDGFQGKEADFIILSLVRNNILTGRRRWGFVTDPHRLNVALSRAKEGLVIVSSMQQINESEMEQGQDHLQQVLRHIEKNGSVLQIDEIGGAKSV